MSRISWFMVAGCVLSQFLMASEELAGEFVSYEQRYDAITRHRYDQEFLMLKNWFYIEQDGATRTYEWRIQDETQTTEDERKFVAKLGKNNLKKLYLLANRQHPGALQLLGDLHIDGVAVEQNTAFAAQYWEQAGHNGQLDALYSLVLLYNGNSAGEQWYDWDQANYWSRMIVQSRQADDFCWRGCFLLTPKPGARHASRECIREGLECLEKAASQGFLPAVKKLIDFHNESDNFGHDLRKMVMYCKQAGELGDMQELSRLGVLYTTGGEGVPQDISRAKEVFLQAAAGGFVPAKTNYARLCKEEGNLTDAIEYFRQAAQEGDAEAQFCLGQVLYEQLPQLSKAARAENVQNAKRAFLQAIMNKEDPSYAALANYELAGFSELEELAKAPLAPDASQKARLEQLIQARQIPTIVNGYTRAAQSGVVEAACKLLELELWKQLVSGIVVERTVLMDILQHCDVGSVYAKSKDAHLNDGKHDWNRACLLEFCAGKGHVPAMLDYAYCCACGSGVLRDLEKAAALLGEVARADIEQITLDVSKFFVEAAFRNGAQHGRVLNITQDICNALESNGVPSKVRNKIYRRIQENFKTYFLQSKQTTKNTKHKINKTKKKYKDLKVVLTVIDDTEFVKQARKLIEEKIAELDAAHGPAGEGASNL